MTKLLIVEDDKNIQKLLKVYLEAEYEVAQVYDGQEALDYIHKNSIDLLITDVMMPKMDGFELVKVLRQEKYDFPILMLTAKDSIQDKTIGFTNGVDDYMSKPINYQELKLRLLALARRTKRENPQKLEIGNVIIDKQTYTAQRDGKEIDFSKKEFELLYKLLSSPNQIFNKEQLLDAVWGEDSFSTGDTVKTHISKLRKLCAPFEDVFKITTVRGLGYKGEIIEK
ncbi:response regulator transcription factor [Lactobacillus sp. PV034]|uniref:response regulator transcription factor n=1 Tax=Lactobacillus sp. PV034 TaxID=2594495 RepID=UPI00223EEED6|nr:response regulator transcription factor [Lactobacillus sp. PV034]QNQ81130.1 response regulator transcription factor [Lactobacillus sp. PV034]